MQAERFRLARLASVGRQEEKLNISIKAKLHIVDVDVVVVGFLLGFFPPWRTQRARLYVFVRGFAFQSLDEEAVGQRGNPTPCENIPFPAGGGDRQVCQKMFGGWGEWRFSCADLLPLYAQHLTRSYFPYRLTEAAGARLDFTLKRCFFSWTN